MFLKLSLMKPLHLLFLLLALSILVLGLQKPMPQSNFYHAFADQRAFFFIPNFWNVVSNLPFAIVGIYGLLRIKNSNYNQAIEIRLLPYLFCFGILAVSFGSAYYHWLPNTQTLVLDRLPMTIGFMSLFTLITFDYCGDKAGKITFWLAHLIGIGSIIYWKMSEDYGMGDLRPYILVQFFPIAVILIFIFAYPNKIDYKNNLLLAVLFYALAKFCEHSDKDIYISTEQLISGHTLKHLLSAVAILFLISIFKKWKSN